MNTLQILMDKFRYGGLSKQEYEMCQPEIIRRNVEALRGILLTFFAILVILSVVSMIPGLGEEPNKNLYLSYMAIVAAQFVIYDLYITRHPGKVLFLAYIFMLTCFSFGTYQAVIMGSDATDTPFCVLLVILPMTIIDTPFKLTNLIITAETITLGSYAIVGKGYGDTFVLVNSLSCAFISIALCYSIQCTKFSDVSNHLMVKLQRDTDMMTGARSRTAYIRDLEMMSDVGYSAGIIYVDINGLKKTNDTYGHEAGDKLIKSAFRIMLKYFHEANDSIYRIGGDEFVIICLGIHKEAFETRFIALNSDIDNKDLFSCGKAWLDCIKDTESAIKEAEVMMYHQKKEYYDSHPEADRRTSTSSNTSTPYVSI